MDYVAAMPDARDRDAQKRQAAKAALDFVQNDSVVGLGSGSTAALWIEMLGRRIADGDLNNVRGVPTSQSSAELARTFGIPLATPADVGGCDVVVDGADEVDPALNLIKGLGGALVREKIVGVASKKRVIVVDSANRVPQLGTRSPLPVEVVRWSHLWAARQLEDVGGRPSLRLAKGGGMPYVTDNDNVIYDVAFDDGIDDPADLERRLLAIPGVVGTGLFLGIADVVLVADDTGVERLDSRR